EHIQRGVQGAGDLPADRDPAAGQPQHQYIAVIAVGRQLSGQDRTRLPAVPEHSSRAESAQPLHPLTAGSSSTSDSDEPTVSVRVPAGVFTSSRDGRGSAADAIFPRGAGGSPRRWQLVWHPTVAARDGV